MPDAPATSRSRFAGATAVVIDADSTVRCARCTTPLADDRHPQVGRHRCRLPAVRRLVACLYAVAAAGIVALLGWLPPVVGWVALAVVGGATLWALVTMPYAIRACRVERWTDDTEATW